MNNNENPRALTLRDLLKEEQYVIPLYQRNFAWEEREIELLLRDIEENNNERYYIGTLIVSKEEKNGKIVYEVIDGQQRLTAVNIIYSVLSKKVNEGQPFELNLSFESREKSNYALKSIRLNGLLDSIEGNEHESFKKAILTIERFVKEALGDDKERIKKYLNEKFLKVCIFLVSLHKLTDKNHYFEVMNNRGEQLEAHEIVKARLMRTLNCEKERNVFAKVWDACSDMNGRLENHSTIKTLWGPNFSEDPLNYDTFDKIVQKLAPAEGSPGATDSLAIGVKLTNIQSYQRIKPNPQEEKPDDGLEEKYSSVIDFPNFLLQVLEIGGFNSDVKMDAGKFLLYEFGCLGDQPQPDARSFLVRLLRLRILFDKFVIKRKRVDRTSRGWKWAIESPKYKNERQYVVNTFDKTDVDADDVDDTDEMPTGNKPMCMLQAMFFVTFRRDVYMRWLTKALSDVDEHPDGSNLWKTLLDYSVSFIKESRASDGVEPNEYKKGLATHHYVFNFLDFHLWYLYYSKITGNNNPDLVTYQKIVEMFDREGVKVGFQYFVFTRRNSIEHYLAQEKGRFKGIREDVINDFGNLSLISRRLNSRLSNRECEEKKEYHDPRQSSSLKYELMLSEKTWGEDEIMNHGRLMVQILQDKSEGYFEDPETSRIPAG